MVENPEKFKDLGQQIPGPFFELTAVPCLAQTPFHSSPFKSTGG
jgi:hypothetical protein